MTARNKAAATGSMHSALYFWYFAVVLGAGVAGGLLFPSSEGGLTALESFGWRASAGFAVAAAVLAVPVMVAFGLGERILFELMSLNDAQGDRPED